MGTYIRRNPRRVFFLVAAALAVCVAVVFAIDIAAPHVGQASSNDASAPQSMGERLTRDKAFDHASKPVAIESGAARKEVASEPDTPIVLLMPPEDKISSCFEEIMPSLEACQSTLCNELRAAKSAYEGDANAVDVLLQVMAAADQSPVDLSLPLAVKLGTRLFQSMSVEELLRLESVVPAVLETSGLYTNSCSLYLIKARAELAKAAGDTSAEIDYRKQFADAALDVVGAHFDDSGIYAAVYQIELLREYRDAVEALIRLNGTPVDFPDTFEAFLQDHSPNLITWALRVWLAHHYHTDGQDHAKAIEYAESSLDGPEFPFLEAAMNDSSVETSAKLKLDLLLGRALHFAGRYDEAKRHFDLILDRYRNERLVGDAAYYAAMSTARVDNAAPDAIVVFQQFLSQFPDHPLADQARLTMSSLYIGDDDLDAAEETLRSITERSSPSPVEDKALAQLGMVLGMHGDNVGAIAAYERALRDYPESSRAGEVLTRLGHASVQVHGVEAAIAVYEDYLKTNPNGLYRTLAEREREALRQVQVETPSSDELPIDQNQ